METYKYYNLLIFILDDIFQHFDHIAIEKINLLEEFMTNPPLATYGVNKIEDFENIPTNPKMLYSAIHAKISSKIRHKNRDPTNDQYILLIDLVTNYYSATTEENNETQKYITEFISLLRSIRMVNYINPWYSNVVNKKLIDHNSIFLKNKQFQLYLEYIASCIKHNIR